MEAILNQTNLDLARIQQNMQDQIDSINARYKVAKTAGQAISIVAIIALVAFFAFVLVMDLVKFAIYLETRPRNQVRPYQPAVERNIDPVVEFRAAKHYGAQLDAVYLNLAQSALSRGRRF